MSGRSSQIAGTVTKVFYRVPFDAAETIELAKVGNKDALSRIWTFLNPGLIRYLASLGCKFAEDIASESWISLAKVLPKFQGDIGSLQGLLFQIARARLYDQLRKDYRQPKASLMLFDESTIAEMSLIDSDFDLDSDSARTRDWLSKIPASQAEVVVLRVIVGLSHYEISQIIGKSQGAVRILFFRGLENLEKVISGRDLTIKRKFSSSA